MLKNTTNSYGLIAKLFHWVMAIIIISLASVGFFMSSMDNSPDKYELYAMHKAMGTIALLLVSLRLLWKMLNQKVMPAKGLPSIIILAAQLGHFVLYIFMLLMPASGLLMSLFGGYDVQVFNIFTIESWEKNSYLSSLFHDVHTTSALMLVAIIALHSLAALYHHFIRKDRTLIRMIK
ncbi:MAG TPA: cytochrome b [Candidatus Megaira endosymbiont of Nemacystus decipiens]|nr:cytochrome b [Candidatus Megaera endosymbiont of Nemacystus decipiens]